jgi:cardiolipin synthase
VLSGPAVADVAQVFADDWSFATREEPALPVPAPPGEGSVVGLVPSGPDQRVNASGLVYFAGIATARRSCWLTTPYFVPDGPTLRALVASAIRGVDVRVLLPARCDVALAGAAARSFYPELVAAGVRIFEYAPAMLHAKTLIADGRWSVVGSANVDMRSFRLNFELGVVLDDLSIASALVRRFEADVAESREITAADLAKLSALTRLGRGLARLASPIL